MRVRRWAALGVAVLLAGVIALVTPWPSGTLREVADRFSPIGATSDGSGTYEPRRLLCLGDNACPSVHRSWTAPSPVTNQQLQTSIEAAGYNASVEGDCGTGSCSARGTSQGWRVEIFAFRNPSDPTTQISLSVQQ